jgi:hypothetical protein
MPIHYTIKDDIFTVVIKGLFDTIAFLDALEEGLGDPKFKPPMRALVDARQAQINHDDEGHAHAPGDRAYAQISHCFIPHWAMVAASDWVLFSIARWICSVSDLRGIDMRAYANVEEARCRLTWSNFYQQDPSCRVPPTGCRPHFNRPALNV